MKSESPYHPMPQDSLEHLSLLTSNGSNDDCSMPQTCSDSKCLRKLRLLRAAFFLQSFLIAILVGGAIGFYSNHVDVSSTYLYSACLTHSYKTFSLTLKWSPCSTFDHLRKQDVPWRFWFRRQPLSAGPFPRGWCRLGRSVWLYAAFFFLYRVQLSRLVSIVGVSRITKEEASKLVNQTYRLPGDEEHYVVHLDVFHQLHCLVGRRSVCALAQFLTIVSGRTCCERPFIRNTTRKGCIWIDSI